MQKPAAKLPSPWIVITSVVGLFLVWGNSFLAIDYLLVHSSLDWLSLTVTRYVIVSVVCLLWLILFDVRESWRVIKRYPIRLMWSGFFCVPAYNIPLYYSQQHGLPPPIAAVVISMVPLSMMFLSAAFLGERLTRRKFLGFSVALAGILLLAGAKEGAGSTDYGVVIAISMIAPVSWAVYSVIAKPITRDVSSVVWTFLSLIIGSLPLFFLMPWYGWAEMGEFDTYAWSALLFLALFATVFGFALWTQIVKWLPATSAGFTGFIAPPVAALSQYVLSVLFPATFVFSMVLQEGLGALLSLIGMGVVVVGRRATTPEK